MTDKPLILGFDTSGAWCSAVILRGNTLLADVHEDKGRGQAERLFPLLDKLLATADLSWRDLDAIGVGIGPGNFTGIRIAVAAARGLSLSLGIPAVGVGLLEATAFGHQSPALACLTAPRDHLYVQGFGTATEIPAQFLAADAVRADWAEPNLACIGPGAEGAAKRLGATTATPKFPVAEAIARITADRWQQSPARPAPLYLKAADAAPPRDPAPVILP